MQISAADPSDDNNDDDAAWDERGDDDDAGGVDDAGTSEDVEGGKSGRSMGLFEVERLVFMDNESARHALELVGLESLSEGDARSLLERRVELGS